MELQPGDLIFYPDDGTMKHHIFALLQQWTNQRGCITGKMTDFTHVAMISNDTSLLVQMVWPKPDFLLFADDTREKVIMRPQCSDVVKQRAISWCYLNIDVGYSMLNMAAGEFGIHRAFKCCSGWLDKAYHKSGFDFLPNYREDKLVSPDEMYCSTKLVKVGP
jgi:hypothetical protein